MPLFRRGLVRGPIGIHDRRGTQATVYARKGALAVPGQPEQLQRPPVPRPGEMDHRLTQLGLLVRVFHEVGLVDDIDQGTRFDDTPEDSIDAQAQFPFVFADIAVQEKIGLAQIGVGAVRIPGVVSVKRGYGNASAFVVLGIGRYLHGQAARMRALAGIRGSLGVEPGLRGKTPGKLDPIGDPVVGVRSGREHRKQYPQRCREKDGEACDHRVHHRAATAERGVHEHIPLASGAAASSRDDSTGCRARCDRLSPDRQRSPRSTCRACSSTTRYRPKGSRLPDLFNCPPHLYPRFGCGSGMENLSH